MDELGKIIDELTANNKIISDVKKQGDQIVEDALERLLGMYQKI